MKHTPALSVKHCSKTYPNGFKALDNISFEVEEGSFLALLGPNGAGKSTIINCITNLVDGYSGDINIFGYDLKTQTKQAKTHIGCVPQEINLNRFETTYNTLINNAGYQGISRAEATPKALEVLERLQLLDKKDAQTGILSGGMKRRAMIARALMHEPPLLILDEPTAGVDVETRRSTWDLLKKLNQEGLTIILTTHYLEEAEALCDNIVVVNHGQIIHKNRMDTLLDSHKPNTIICTLQQDIPETLKLNQTHKQLNHNSFIISHSSIDDIPSIFEQLQQQDLRIKNIQNPTSKLESIYIELIEQERNKS